MRNNLDPLQQSANPPQPSPTRLILRSLGEDFRTLRRDEGLMSAVGNTALALTIIPYQVQGAEMTIAFAGAHTYGATHNPFLTGLAAGATSLAIESGLTGVSGHSLTKLSHTVRTYEAIKYEGKEAPVPSDKPGVLARIGNGAAATGFALGLGSPGTVLRSFVRSPERGVSYHERQGLKTAGSFAVANTVLGTAVTGGFSYFLKPEWTNSALDVLEDPRTYAGLFAVLSVGRLATYFHRRRTAKAAA